MQAQPQIPFYPIYSYKQAREIENTLENPLFILEYQYNKYSNTYKYQKVQAKKNS